MPGDVSHSSLARAYRQAGPYLTLGVEFVAAILLCLFVGRWLDDKLGTTPFLMLTGTFVGAGAGFYHFFKTVLRLQKKQEQEAGKGGA